MVSAEVSLSSKVAAASITILSVAMMAKCVPLNSLSRVSTITSTVVMALRVSSTKRHPSEEEEPETILMVDRKVASLGKPSHIKKG